MLDFPCICRYRTMFGMSSGSGILLLEPRDRTTLSAKGISRPTRTGGMIGLSQRRIETMSKGSVGITHIL